jgi:hypothetical protein
MHENVFIEFLSEEHSSIIFNLAMLLHTNYMFDSSVEERLSDLLRVARHQHNDLNVDRLFFQLCRQFFHAQVLTAAFLL